MTDGLFISCKAFLGWTNLGGGQIKTSLTARLDEYGTLWMLLNFIALHYRTRTLLRTLNE